jgi:hypothetical protein
VRARQVFELLGWLVFIIVGLGLAWGLWQTAMEHLVHA